MKKKALIIGGSGGLSSEVARKAIAEDYEVFAVTRGKRPLPAGINSICVDRNNDEAFEKELLSSEIRFDVVYDCICMNEEHAKQDLEVLPKITNRLVIVSTDSVYHPLYKKTPQNEEGIFIEEDGTTDEVSYGCNKRRMEVTFLNAISNNSTSLNITIFRPGHIYGPGFLLGCFPENSRQKELPDIIKEGKPVRLVGAGTYLIHPIYVEDLARVIVECTNNEKTYNQIFCIGGPQAIENRTYYECIANILGVKLKIEEIPLLGYLEKHPEYSGHLCHRIYDLTKLKETGIKLPETSLDIGIRKQIELMH